MSEISRILFESNRDILQKAFDQICDAYETNPMFRVKKFYEGDEVKGFCVTMERDGLRVLSEAHYVGNNKYTAVRMWKWMTRGAKTLQVSVMRVNTRICEFFKNHGFEVIDDSQPLCIIFKMVTP